MEPFCSFSILDTVEQRTGWVRELLWSTYECLVMYWCCAKVR